MVNAIRHQAAIVVKKSLQEGFGLRNARMLAALACMPNARLHLVKAARHLFLRDEPQNVVPITAFLDED
jgi:hypothetical protein